MVCFATALFDCHFGQLRTEALIDQKRHPSSYDGERGDP